MNHFGESQTDSECSQTGKVPLAYNLSQRGEMEVGNGIAEDKSSDVDFCSTDEPRKNLIHIIEFLQTMDDQFTENVENHTQIFDSTSALLDITVRTILEEGPLVLEQLLNPKFLTALFGHRDTFHRMALGSFLDLDNIVVCWADSLLCKIASVIVDLCRLKGCEDNSKDAVTQMRQEDQLRSTAWLPRAWSDLPSIWASDNVPPLTRRIASSLLYGAFIIRPHLIHVAPWGDEQVAGGIGKSLLWKFAKENMNKWSVDSAMQEGQSLEDIAITIALLVVADATMHNGHSPTFKPFRPHTMSQLYECLDRLITSSVYNNDWLPTWELILTRWGDTVPRLWTIFNNIPTPSPSVITALTRLFLNNFEDRLASSSFSLMANENFAEGHDILGEIFSADLDISVGIISNIYVDLLDCISFTATEVAESTRPKLESAAWRASSGLLYILETSVESPSDFSIVTGIMRSLMNTMIITFRLVECTKLRNVIMRVATLIGPLILPGIVEDKILDYALDVQREFHDYNKDNSKYEYIAQSCNFLTTLLNMAVIQRNNSSSMTTTTLSQLYIELSTWLGNQLPKHRAPMDSDQSMHESVLRSAVVLLCELKRKNIEDHALIDHGPLKLLYFIIEGQPIEELFWTSIISQLVLCLRDSEFDNLLTLLMAWGYFRDKLILLLRFRYIGEEDAPLSILISNCVCKALCFLLSNADMSLLNFILLSPWTTTLVLEIQKALDPSTPGNPLQQQYRHDLLANCSGNLKAVLSITSRSLKKSRGDARAKDHCNVNDACTDNVAHREPKILYCCIRGTYSLLMYD